MTHYIFEDDVRTESGVIRKITLTTYGADRGGGSEAPCNPDNRLIILKVQEYNNNIFD